MARPEGIIKKTKNNSRKKYHEAKDFAEGKRLGRPKQVWVIDSAPVLGNFLDQQPKGHWEKVTTNV